MLSGCLTGFIELYSYCWKFSFFKQIGVSYSGPPKIAQTSRLRTSGYRSANQGASGPAGRGRRPGHRHLGGVLLGGPCSHAGAARLVP